MRNLAVRGIYISLALLTFFAVFVATVGAREALATRTQAIRQTIAANPALSRTITVDSTWTDVQGALASSNPYGPAPTVTPSTISAIGGQLRTDFDRGPVTLSPAGADLSLMTTGLNLLPSPSTLPGTGGTSVRIEITERQPFPSQTRLVSGRYPVATAAPSTSSSAGMTVITQPGAKPIVVNPVTGKPITVKPGAKLSGGKDSLMQISMDYINTHGKDKDGQPLGKYYIHGVSHHLGLDVHDPGDRNRPL